jgi:hypothetical protein
MTHNSIDLTGVPGFKADGPAASHHPKPMSLGEAVAHVALASFILGLVVGIPLFSVLRMMGAW